MAQIISRPELTVRLRFEVDESEARALDALAGYGDDAFVKAFYEKLGEAYMKEHEAGLRKFLASIRGIASSALSQVDRARYLLIEEQKERIKGIKGIKATK